MIRAILLLSAFFGGWVGFAIAASKRGWSKTVGVGGGFIVGCLMILPVGILGSIFDKQPAKQAATVPALHETPPNVVAITPPAAQIASKPGLGITYQQMMRDLDEYFPRMEDAALATGEKRKIGKSDREKAAAIIEVIGDSPASVDRVSLSFFAVSDNAMLNVGNFAILSLMARNAFPDWPGAGMKIMDGIEKVSNQEPKPGKPNAAQHIHADKVIKISLVKDLGMFSVTIKSKDAK